MPRTLAIIAALFASFATSGEAPCRRESPLELTRIDVHSFKVLESYSGPVSYYKIVEDPEQPFIRAMYRPPLETVTLGAEVPEALRRRTRKIRWRWRAQALPRGPIDCRTGPADSAAAVYVSWKRGLKWYSLKYVWSSEGERGRTCEQKRNLFVAQDTVIAESGGPLGIWKEEEIDPSAEFIAHFESCNPDAAVPDLAGLGLMSDGD